MVIAERDFILLRNIFNNFYQIFDNLKFFLRVASQYLEVLDSREG